LTNPKEIAENIDNYAFYDDNACNSIKFMMLDKDFPSQVDEGSEFGRALASHLRDMGWEHYIPLSHCTKATFEAHLRKRGAKVRVVIISSCFMGSFTQIDTFLPVSPWRSVGFVKERK
jgi:hypothetical protein